MNAPRSTAQSASKSVLGDPGSNRPQPAPQPGAATGPLPRSALRVLLVDDEALARARLRTLLGDCGEPAATVAGEAADAVSAMQWLAHHTCDVVLLDIHLPGTDGLQLAQVMGQLAQPPAVVFVTAHAEHAVKAFDLAALDYLTKPVRLDRLQTALRKVEQRMPVHKAQEADLTQNFLLIQDRGRTERIPLVDILHLKAELKYVTVRTATRSLVYDGSLAELEARHGPHWLRIHRNALVARHAVRALIRHHDTADTDIKSHPVDAADRTGAADKADKSDGWAVRLAGVPEPLPVSRRQLAAVREVLAQG